MAVLKSILSITAFRSLRKLRHHPEDFKILRVTLYAERRRLGVTFGTKHYSFSLFCMNYYILFKSTLTSPSRLTLCLLDLPNTYITLDLLELRFSPKQIYSWYSCIRLLETTRRDQNSDLEFNNNAKTFPNL